MKPFATLGSEISKVRERVRKGAEALHPAKVASDVRDQRDRLLAKLGEQTFRLIAERKLQVPKVLQDSVDKLATLLGVQLPPQSVSPEAASDHPPTAEPPSAEKVIEGAVAAASDPLHEPVDVDEPSIGDTTEAAPLPAPAPAPAPEATAPPANPPKKQASAKKIAPTKKKGGKRRAKR